MTQLAVDCCTYKTKTDRLCNRVFTLFSEANPFFFSARDLRDLFIFCKRLEAAYNRSM
jgi:hypothetical protein